LRRRDFITLVGAAAFAWPAATRAQQTAVPVVGYFSLGSRESDAVHVIGLQRGRNEVGYVEGRSVTIEYRWDNQLNRLPALAADLVQKGQP
jgi:putative tryptophan/tyrosine transport system substrate-binding protein